MEVSELKLSNLAPTKEYLKASSPRSIGIAPALIGAAVLPVHEVGSTFIVKSYPLLSSIKSTKDPLVASSTIPFMFKVAKTGEVG